MIYGVFANQKSFKSVTFVAGLNVILAEKSDNSTEKDTRNGVGKTTLLNIIHFCLGSDKVRSNLPIEELVEWAFTIEMDIGINRIRATRYIANPNVILLEGDFIGWPIHPEKSENFNEFYVSNDDWKKVLGYFLFKSSEVKPLKYKPSFRSLISYFIRAGADAYTDPFKYFRAQKTWDWQVNNAFLLGLNWEQASELQELREKEKSISALQTATKSGMVASLGELEAERVRLEELIEAEKISLSTYKVLPQYEDIQRQADKFSQELHKLANENIINQKKLERYRESIASENPPSESELENVYREAGLLFSEGLKHSLSEAKEFHRKLIQNRRLFLEVEITQINNSIDKNKDLIKKIIDERASLLEIFKTHGALEELICMQESHSKNQEQLGRVKEKITDLRDLTKKKQDIRLAKVELEKKSERDYEEHRSRWEQFVRAFNDNSKALYDEPGNLIINVTDNGYKFGINIQRSNSEGIGKMKIFCYDLTLMQIFSQDESCINFLIHDSTIFDGVDSRQRALAFERISILNRQQNIQYICTLNSDMIPLENLRSDFNFEQYIRLKLSDKDPKDSLLGFKFNT